MNIHNDPSKCERHVQGPAHITAAGIITLIIVTTKLEHFPQIEFYNIMCQ